MPKSHWDVPKRSWWTFVDRVTGKMIEVMVTRKFETTDGWFVHLMHKPEGPLPQNWGNAPITELLERIKR